MKWIVNILLLFLLATWSVTLTAQINPTTHLKPAQDTGRVLISKESNRYVERNLYTYLKDSLNFGLAVVDSTRLTADSVLIYYNAGTEVGRDTIRLPGGAGGTTAAAGDSTQIQFNGGNGNTFAADPDLYFSTAVNILYTPNLYITDIFGHQGDNDTYLWWTDDRCQIYAGAEPMMDIFEGVQDYVKLGDGGDVDVNLNDDLYVQGSNGYIGIGTTAPIHQLDIVVNTANMLRMYAASAGAQTIRLQESTNYGDVVYDDLDLTYNTSSSLGAHLFKHAGTTVFSTLSTQVSLGTSVDLNFSSSSDINDSNGSTGSTGHVLKKKSGGGVEWAAESGGLTVGGSSGNVQYNNGAGGLGGESTFTYNSTTNQLTIEDLYVTDNLLDGIGSAGTNLEILSTTGTESRWRTVSMSASLGLLTFSLDGVSTATADLSLADLSDAGKIFNNNATQNFYQVSPTKITEWGTTPSFSGTGISWVSASDRWSLTYSGKYRVKCMINVDGTAEATPTPIRFEIRINNIKSGIYYHYYADPDRNITCSIDEVFDLNASDYVEIFVQRGDSGTGKTVTMSTSGESYFMLERINY